MEFWVGLTLPQANVLAALFTMLAGVIAVIGGGWIFGKKVASLQSAIESTNKDLESHIAKLELALANVKVSVLEKVAEIEEIALKTGERVASESGKDSGDDSRDLQSKDRDTSNATDPRARLLSAWDDIRKKLEATASDDTVDGRTRAKYLRIDRRSYRELALALIRDGRLSAVSAEIESATALRNQVKRGKLEVADQHAAEMEAWRDRIISQ